LRHYAQITEADQREAVKLSVLNSGKKRVQNPVHEVQNQVQFGTAGNGIDLHDWQGSTAEKLCFCGLKPQNTKACESMRLAGLSIPMGPLGLEPRTQGL
jgi:hypothetical protein